MWFIPNSSGELGNGQSWNDPQALARPVTDGVQNSPKGTAVTAVPYNPRYNLLPDANTSTVINDTACGIGEFGCEPTTVQVCPAGYPNLHQGRCYNNNGQWSNPTNTTRYRHTTYGRNQAYAVSIRVQVCDGTLDTRSFCTAYGSNHKPEGLLQQNSKKTRYSLFAYLTQSGETRTGGVMRARQKLIGPVTALETAGTEKPYPDRARMTGIDNPEWDPVTGKIINDPDSTDSSATTASVGSCNNAPDGSGCTIRYSGVINYLNRFGQINTG